MKHQGILIRDARRRAGLSQRQLAAIGGTSGPTVAAYESGHVQPRVSTLERLLAAAGQRLLLATEPLTPPTREERRSLFIHRVIAEEVAARPGEAIAKARANLATMRRADTAGRAAAWFDSWDNLLSSPPEAIRVMQDPSAVDMRQNTPFAGVLSPRARWDAYRRFRESDRSNESDLCDRRNESDRCNAAN